MDDLLDVEKLNKFLESESGDYQNNLKSELHEFINVAEEEESDSNAEEDYSNEIENDLQEHEKSKALERQSNLAKIAAEVSNLTDINAVSLTEDEQDTINKCEIPELKRLMILNRTKNIRLVKLLNKTIECVNRINRLIWESKQSKPTNKEVVRPGTCKLGYPYFKTKEFYACPLNADVFKKRRNNELTRLQPFHKWLAEDEALLKTVVGLNYLFYRERQIRNRITELKEKDESSLKEEENADEIEELNEQLAQLRGQEELEMPALNDDDVIDWYKIENEFNGRHTAIECRSFWNLYLHPSINKSNWTSEENDKILNLVAKHKRQNWDTIAEELGTNRTGFSACIHYFSKLCEKYPKTRFFPDEDEFLLQVIAACRIGNYIPWTKVQYYFQNRSKHQLYHRYRYYLAIDKPINRATFNIEEDILLVCLVQRFGKDFQKVASHVPNRTSMQIKNRYNCYLENMNTYVGPWTIEEDKKILAGVEKYGRNWSKIAKEMNRIRLSVRHRYWVLSQWKEKHPDGSLENVPRRHMLSFIKNQMHQQSKIRLIAEQFKGSEEVPTIEAISRALSKRKRPSFRGVVGKTHASLLDFFLSSYNRPTKVVEAAKDTVEHTANVIRDVLKVLDANLEIPDDASLENSSSLDEQDASILKLLRSQLASGGSNNSPGIASGSGVKWLIPPNKETVLGLRGLIMKNSADKNKTINKDADLNADLRALEVGARAQALHERDLFQQRIYSLFTWPSVLSLTEPGSALKTALIPEEPKVVMKKSVGRPTSYVKKNLAKVEKMLQARKLKKDLSANVNKVPKTSDGKVGIRVRRFADCSNFSKREGLRPRAIKSEPESTVSGTVTTLRQVNFAEVQKAMANKQKPKIFLIANDESSDGVQRANAKKITGRMYLKKFSTGVNVGASTSTQPEPTIDEDGENVASVGEKEIPSSATSASGLQNGVEIAHCEANDSFNVLENRCVRTYKRKRKDETQECPAIVNAGASTSAQSEPIVIDDDDTVSSRAGEKETSLGAPRVINGLQNGVKTIQREAGNSSKMALENKCLRTYKRKRTDAEVGLKKLPVGVNLGASTSSQPELIVVDLGDDVVNGMCIGEKGRLVNRLQGEVATVRREVSNLSNVKLDNKFVYTYKRKRKDDAGGEQLSENRAVGVVKVESEIESLERDISILDGILNSDKKCS